MARSDFKDVNEANSGITSRRAGTEDGCRKELECKGKLESARKEGEEGRKEEKEEWKELAETTEKWESNKGDKKEGRREGKDRRVDRG